MIRCGHPRAIVTFSLVGVQERCAPFQRPTHGLSLPTPLARAARGTR